MSDKYLYRSQKPHSAPWSHLHIQHQSDNTDPTTKCIPPNGHDIVRFGDVSGVSRQRLLWVHHCLVSRVSRVIQLSHCDMVNMTSHEDVFVKGKQDECKLSNSSSSSRGNLIRPCRGKHLNTPVQPISHHARNCQPPPLLESRVLFHVFQQSHINTMDLMLHSIVSRYI